MQEIGHTEADVRQYLWHLAREGERLAVGFVQVNSETVKRYEDVVGEATIAL